MRTCKLRHDKPVDHAHPLVREFWRLMRESRASAMDVAERAGVNDHTMSRWRYRYSPRLTSFEAALNVLGYELCIRERRDCYKVKQFCADHAHDTHDLQYQRRTSRPYIPQAHDEAE